MNTPQPGQIYQHYKHDPNGEVNNYTYEIIKVIFDASIDELAVVYKPLYVSGHLQELGLEHYVRPLSNFTEEVTLSSGEVRARFVRVGE